MSHEKLMKGLKTPESPSMLRQRWLEAAVTELRPHFLKQGFEVPAKLRISMGWSFAGGEKVLGTCHPLEASSDKHHEIFIAPSMHDGVKIVATIIREIVHALLPPRTGHRGPFKQAALAMGLEGKMTATTGGPLVVEWAEKFIAKHGAYPAGSLSRDKGRKKQSTRLLKAECATCGYTVRVTKKWIDESGAPHCGVKSHGRMDCDVGEEEGEED